MDSSKLIPSDQTQTCIKTPALATSDKHSVYSLVGGGEYGTYDWSPGKTNGGQIWKTRLAYTKSSLAQIKLVATSTRMGATAHQRSLAQRVNSVSYINGDFFHLRGSNLLYSAMVQNSQLTYAPASKTEILGVVEEAANERTGIQGASTIRSGKVSIATQGLNLSYIAQDSVVAYNQYKQASTLPSVAYVVTTLNGVVTSSDPATSFSLPTKSGELTFVASGTGVTELAQLKKGDSVTYDKPKNAKTTRLLRTALESNGTIALQSGKSVAIKAVNDRNASIKTGVVLYTHELNGSTYPLGMTIVTDLNGKVLSISSSGKGIQVAAGRQVIQVGTSSESIFSGVSVGDQLKITNSYAIKKNLPLAAAFGDRENTMINGVVVASCSSGHEDIRPRTAIGWNENGDVWFATTTMGVRNAADVFNRFRLGGSSVHQLTMWLKDLGATQAIALDGGGSTTMYVKQVNGSYKRVDLPETEWVRDVPQGVAMVAR